MLRCAVWFSQNAQTRSDMERKVNIGSSLKISDNCLNNVSLVKSINTDETLRIINTASKAVAIPTSSNVTDDRLDFDVFDFVFESEIVLFLDGSYIMFVDALFHTQYMRNNAKYKHLP